VVGSTQLIEVKGKKVRGRLYPWGVVELENDEHCDYLKLRTMLISHMQDLQEVTHDLHYENYRATRLADGSDSDGPGNFITKISFIIVTINLKVWTNHVQLYQNQIQISS